MTKKSKKKNKEINMENTTLETKQEDIIQQTNSIPTTHQALSIVRNKDKSYSVVSIKFNPQQQFVSDEIEVIETNTDMFIIQERLSVLLFDVNNNVLEDYE